MPAPRTADAKPLERLRDEYQRRSAKLKAQAHDTPVAKRLAQKEAGVLYACAQDIDDLINGREHPSGRRS